MKEFGVFIVVVLLSLVLYWGIEPYAHHELHPQTSMANYDFEAEDLTHAQNMVDNATKALELAKSSNDEKKIVAASAELENAKILLQSYTDFWNDIKSIDLSKGDAMRGSELFMNAGCIGCHSLIHAGFEPTMDDRASSESFGVAVPDLSTAGAIYDEKFLAAIIKDPVRAVKLNHKFGEEQMHPMPQFFGAGGSDVNLEIADLVAYLKSVSNDYIGAHGGISDEVLFKDACQRCHDIKYDEKYILGNKLKLTEYMGSMPPDLSMMIRAKNSDNYLNKLINNPQKMLPGTSMPRVGLNEQYEQQLVGYLEKVGDSKKSERENIGIYTMVYFLILGIFATLWKRKVWKELH